MCISTSMSLRSSYCSLFKLQLHTANADDPRNKYQPRLHSNDLAQPAQPLYINMLHNVYVFEYFKQLTNSSDAGRFANTQGKYFILNGALE